MKIEHVSSPSVPPPRLASEEKALLRVSTLCGGAAAVTYQQNLAGVHADEVIASDGTDQSEGLQGVVASIIIIGRDSR